MADIITGTAIEGSTIYLLARINGNEGVAVQQADLEEIVAEVWKQNPPTQFSGWQGKYVTTTPPERFGDPKTVTIATAIMDTLEDDDPRWTVDEVGYNFILPLGPDDLDEIALADYPKGQFYRVDVRFTPAAVGETPFVASYFIDQQSSLIGKGA